MGRTRRGVSDSVGMLEKEVGALRRELVSMQRRMQRQEARLRELADATKGQQRRQGVIMDALQLGEAPRKGERGVVRDLQDSIVRLEDYLLKTADRIENILAALKQHRELLASVNKHILDVGTKDRIRLELDVMKNTLSILSLNGVDFDASLVKEIEKVRQKLGDSKDLLEVERSKTELDRHFDGELKKFDLEAIWSRKKEIPGYR